MKKPVALIILDGFGYNPSDYGNAITAAKTPNIDKLFETCPHTLIGASGMDVGLPDGQMGNSEAVSYTHLDVYKRQTLDDLYTTGFFDYLDGNNILAIEWSENIEAALPEETILVRIDAVDETTRRITIKGGPAFEYSSD